ncbi:MAG: SPOR domain-containing protein [Spirochaetaceae bacterium]|jgi:hypothetical protein|nr:SPOR domain-containing protein [Spirochaetaceae bacterium]
MNKKRIRLLFFMAFAVFPALCGFAGGVTEPPALTVVDTQGESRLVYVNWNNIKQPEKYRWGLYRFDMEEKTYTFVTELKSLQSSYLDEDLEPPVSKYFYKVEMVEKNAEFTNTRPIRIRREDVLQQLSAYADIGSEAAALETAPPGIKNASSKSASSAKIPAWYSAGNEGIYVGIISFSGKVNDITQRPDGAPTLVPLDAPGRQVLLEYLDRSYVLSKSNGTALYYADHKAIANLSAMEKENALPSNLDSVTLITFTDGTDTSSTDVEFPPIEGRDFRHRGTGTGYRAYISQQLAARRIAGVKINAWAIGILGKDVDGNAEFSQTLEAVASGPDNVAQVSFISQLDEGLGAIANGLNIYTPMMDLTFSTPAYPIGTLVRLTFDGDIHSPDSSECYVDARVGWDEGGKSYYLTVVDSYGIRLAGIRRMDGKRNETGIYYTLTLNNDFNESGVRQWYIQPGENAAGWIRNSESGSETEKKADFTHERKSAVVYLVLDCSASLSEKEIHDVRAAMAAFINRLYDISSSKIELAAVGNYLPQGRAVENAAVRTERTVQPETGRQQQNTPAVPPASQRAYEQGAYVSPETGRQQQTTPVVPPASQRAYGQGAYVPQTGLLPQSASDPQVTIIPQSQSWQQPPAVRFTRQETYPSQAVSPPPASPAAPQSSPLPASPVAPQYSPPVYESPVPAQADSASPEQDVSRSQLSSPAAMQTFYWVQAGSYTDAARAHRAWSAFAKAGLGRAEIFSSDINGTIHYRVKAGPYTDRTIAEEELARMKSYSAEYRNSFIVNE